MSTQASCLRIALCQMTSVDSIDYNYLQICDLAKEASEKGGEILFFPENSLYMRLRNGEMISGFGIEDPIFEKIKEIAIAEQVSIHLGSVPLREGRSLFNSSILITSEGKIQSSYKKIHLFDIELDGQKAIRESDVFENGKGAQSIQFGQWSFGQTICYDLRFSELFSIYAKNRVDAILVPSAFLPVTGRAHWEVLLRARAIESQCYIVAAAQAGVHKNACGDQRETYGQSMVVDPWGEVLVRSSVVGPDVLVCELEIEKIQKVRRQIPMSGHRRL